MLRKLISALLLIAFMLSLTACASAGLSTSQLSEEKKAELERAWAEQNYPIDWDAEVGEPCSLQYYGTFEDYDVFRWYRPDAQDGKTTTKYIDDIPFIVNSKTDTIACRDGVFEHLGVLRVMKKISYDAIVQIAQAHADAVSLPISKTKRQEIESVWHTRVDWKWSTSGSQGCRYYGSYDGYDLIFYQGSGLMLDVLSSIDIAGEWFDCGNPFKLYGYRNGKFHELSELYERGEISKEAIADAAKIHREWSPTFYQNNTT